MRISSFRPARKALLVTALLSLAATVLREPTAEAARPSPYPITTCTIAAPSRHATIDVEIANASDFCELVSQALASEVFHARLLVTPIGGMDR